MASDQEHMENIIKYREYYNRELKDIGVESPTPQADQKGGKYRRTSLQTFVDSLLPRSHKYAKVDFHELPYDAVKVMEPQVLEACVTEYQNPDNVPPGTLRKIEKKDGFGHLERVEFIGPDWFGCLHNLGVPNLRLKDQNGKPGREFNWLGGARLGRRTSIFNERTREWYPPRRQP
jgi:hypothetical protein